MVDAILKVDHLSKYFAHVKALDDITFDVKRGEIHALCGENGAGKSTFIKLLTGAHEPTKGKITFDGNEYDRGKGGNPECPGCREAWHRHDLSGIQPDSISDSGGEYIFRAGNTEIWRAQYKENGENGTGTL